MNTYLKRAGFIALMALTLIAGIAIGFRLGRTSLSPVGTTATSAPQPTSAPTLPTGVPAEMVGVGVLSDSNSDEYRADDNRGGEYAATTLNWLELLAQRRGLNFGAWGDWDEWRRTGYEYNWSHSGALTHDLIRFNAHTGLARQVAEGKVSHVLVWVGVNDFAVWNGNYASIYNGDLSDDEIQAGIESIVADVTTMVDTVRAAGPVKIALVTIGDLGIAPDTAAAYPDAEGRSRVSAIVDSINTQLKAMAQERGVAMIDAQALLVALAARADANGALHMGAETISTFAKGNEPHSGRLDDAPGHAGTIMSGVIANALFVEPFNQAFGLNIAPLTDEEILESAGLASGAH
ncbi:MAG TPA: GDSL-type esterase/lipase family protein [Anaerolineae bacterium]|nr:GDSL-type esterase/lipase family protein [Anaerolineae bacterium]